MNWLKSNALTIIVLILIIAMGWFIYKEVKEAKEAKAGNTGIAGGLPQEVADALANGAMSGAEIM